MGDDIRLQFGQHLRSLRRQRELSQEELAFQCGLSQTYLSQVEKGRRNISLKNIERIALALGVEMREMMPSKAE